MKTTMLKAHHLLIAITGFTLLLSACRKDVLSGQGAIITETRSLQAFEQVILSGQPDAEIIYSNESKIEVSGYANLVAAYKTDVRNGKLDAHYPAYTVVRHDNISLKIYTNTLSKIDISGTSKVYLGPGFSGQQFSAHLSGDTRLESGAAQYQYTHFDISGLSRVMARPMVAEEARVDISGESLIELTANQKLKVDISGKADVHYWGNPPTVEEHISGLGKLFRRS